MHRPPATVVGRGAPAGPFTTFAVPGEGLTLPTGINASGQITGVAYNSPGLFQQGFLYSGGVMTMIDVPGAIATTPYSINDRGEITGTYGGLTGPLQDLLP
jgi:probable HAF family extracellular repeat protein